MFNIGPQELLLILVLALLVVGPKRLPEIARTVGKSVRELRKAQDEVRKTIQVSLADEPSTRDRSRPPRRLPVDAMPPDADASEGPSTDEPLGEGPAVSGTDVAGATAASAAAGSPAPSPVSEVSRTLGRTLAELRRAREEVQRSFRVDRDPTPAPRRSTSAPPPGATDVRPPGVPVTEGPREDPTEPPTTRAPVDPVDGPDAAT